MVSGSSTQTVYLSSIPQTYKDLCVIALVKTTNTGSAGQSGLDIEFQNSIAGALSGAPGQIGMQYGSSTPYTYLYSSRAGIPTYTANNTSSYTGVGPQWLMIYDYSSTTVAKNVWLFNGITGQHTQNDNNTFQAWRSPFNNGSNSPIDVVVFKNQSGNYFLPNTSFSVYGING